jgi:hypothetical protein
MATGYLKGELNINYKGRDKWVIANTNKHLCACGCGGYIVVRKYHSCSSMGIPKFIHGHNTKTEEHRKLSSEIRSKCIGPLHPHYKKDRSEIKGPRRAAHCFAKYQRRLIYVRDQGICQSCGAFTLWNAKVQDPLKTNIDHTIDIKFGGSNEIDNGRVLCLMCHKMKHSSIENGMNCWKPRTGNQQPSVQSTKVQRLLEHSDMLNNQDTVSHPKGKI